MPAIAQGLPRQLWYPDMLNQLGRRVAGCVVVLTGILWLALYDWLYEAMDHGLLTPKISLTEFSVDKIWMRVNRPCFNF